MHVPGLGNGFNRCFILVSGQQMQGSFSERQEGDIHEARDVPVRTISSRCTYAPLALRMPGIWEFKEEESAEDRFVQF